MTGDSERMASDLTLPLSTAPPHYPHSISGSSPIYPHSTTVDPPHYPHSVSASPLYQPTVTTPCRPLPPPLHDLFPKPPPIPPPPEKYYATTDICNVSMCVYLSFII